MPQGISNGFTDLPMVVGNITGEQVPVFRGGETAKSQTKKPRNQEERTQTKCYPKVRCSRQPPTHTERARILTDCSESSARHRSSDVQRVPTCGFLVEAESLLSGKASRNLI